MSLKIAVDVDTLVNLDNILKGLEDTFNDEKLNLSINNALARYCDPYVPFLNNPLSKTIDVTPEGVTYTQPYARYQYYGEVYGPNIPIKQNGIVVGWFSPPGKPKHPTGRRINYTKDFHPLATHHWDEAMMRDRGEQFCNEVGDLISHRWEELHGDGR